MTANKPTPVVPNLRFPEFRDAPEWSTPRGDTLFDSINNRRAVPGLPVLAITQEHGAIPRDQIDYHVSVTAKSVASYKEVCEGDFIISLRSFQGGIEYSRYHGICSPAYVILRRKGGGNDHFFRHLFKSDRFVQQLTRNIEGIRDGKMISYAQFSEQLLPVPEPPEQQKIADCLGSLDDLIAAEGRKLEALRQHKQGLMQQLFPQPGEIVPRLRFPEFTNAREWRLDSVAELVEARCLYSPKDGNHGNLHPKSSDYVSDGIPFIMAKDLKGGLIDTSSCYFISKELADSLKKGFARKGDVLLSHKGTVGEVAVVREIKTPYLMLTPQVTYYRVRDGNRLSNEFLARSFLSDFFQSNLRAASGGGTRSYIGITEQAKLRLFYPKDINEQQCIASCLTILDNLINAQTKRLETLKTHKNGLMQQLFPRPVAE